MPEINSFSDFLNLLQTAGWPAGLYLLYRAGKAVASAVKGAWDTLLPYLVDILVSHRDLMKTANVQMPKQTAILEELTAGQRESKEILKSLHTSVEDLRRDLPATDPASTG